MLNYTVVNNSIFLEGKIILELHTRIKNKIDTLENWQSNNPILLKGKFAITITTISMNNAPIKAFLVKVGDGEKHYNDLPFMQAISSDVYDWAKQPTKPIYTADEITGLHDAIGKAIEESFAGGEEEDQEPIVGLVYAYGSFYDQVSSSVGGTWLNYTVTITNNSQYRARVFWSANGVSSSCDLDSGASSSPYNVGGSSSPEVSITQVIRIA